MGKVIVVVVALVVLLIVLRLMLSRRDRGTELFVTEARGRQSFDGPMEAGPMEAGPMEAGPPGDAQDGRDARDIKRASLGSAPGEFLAEARRLKERRRAIDAVKLIRAHTGLGLKEAKDLYDSL
jgi:hypothetical protein